jgi:hypothetical protein
VLVKESLPLPCLSTGGAYRGDSHALLVSLDNGMSDSHQTASRLAQVARRLEGTSPGFPPSTSQPESLSLPISDGLPSEPTLVALIDIGTNRAYVAVEEEDGIVALELGNVTADEALQRVRSVQGATANHATSFVWRRHPGGFVGLAHPPTGRFLQAKKQGMRRLVFFANTLGINEQFEVSDIRGVNGDARFKSDPAAALATLTLRPRRFPNVALHVRLVNLVPEQRPQQPPNPLERAILSGTSFPSNAFPFGSRLNSGRATPRTSETSTSAPQSPSRNAVPAFRPSGKPPAHGQSQIGSANTSTYTTPNVSPNTFAIRKTFREKLSLAPTSAGVTETNSLAGSAAKQSAYGKSSALSLPKYGKGMSSSYGGSLMSTPGRLGLAGLAVTPGGGVAVGEVSQDDALDLGLRLMSKFARESAMGGNRRYARQVFSLWVRHHQTLKKHASRVVQLASLMRRYALRLPNQKPPCFAGCPPGITQATSRNTDTARFTHHRTITRRGWNRWRAASFAKKDARDEGTYCISQIQRRFCRLSRIITHSHYERLTLCFIYLSETAPRGFEPPAHAPVFLGVA